MSDVEVIERGEGEPIVLLSGLGARASSLEPLTRRLAGRWRCISVSASIGAGQRPSMRRLAERVVEVLDGRRIATAHVVGNSFGGILAQALAVDHPAAVRSLVLLATTPGVLSIPSSPGCAAGLAAAAVTRGRSRRRFLEAALRGPRDVWETDEDEEMSVAGGPGGWRQIRAVLGWVGVRHLRRLEVPTLVVHGDRDGLVPLVNARLCAALVPGARLDVVRGAGHFILSDAPNAVAERVAGFLTDLRREPPVVVATHAAMPLPVAGMA